MTLPALRPCLQSLIKRYHSSCLVGHEVGSLEPAILCVLVGIHCAKRSNTALDAEPHVQGASFPAVLGPPVELPQAQSFLGFGDRAAERDRELVPELFGGCEVVVFPRLFTS